jgi:large subunit ribosomal protein L3
VEIMPKKHSPRKGSLGYSPRKRVKSIIPRLRSWPELDRVVPIAFAGYKVGMTHAIVIENNPHSPLKGMEIAIPLTIVETPPLLAIGARCYKQTSYGLKVSGEIWADNFPKQLKKAKKKDFKKEKAETSYNAKHKNNDWSKFEESDEIKLITATQPRLAGLPKKNPEIMEQPLGGSISEKLTYVKENLGKEINVFDVFSEGDLVDIITITKGKGTQGPVKRWGVKLLPAKSEKFRRKPGSMGPWTPKTTSWRIPQAGQTGYHQRTIFNLPIYKVGRQENKLVMKGDFLHYGKISSDYLILRGSIGGPPKRLVRIRFAIRKKKKITVPEIKYLSTSSKQGV